MPVKIRLQRHGKKGKPFYWIVAADSRAKRDGRYLKKLGTYNPNTNPATINLDLEDAVVWLEKGAQPTDTARTLLSYKGAMMRHHLNGGVKKGALTQEEADKKFMAWLEEKQAKIQAKKDGLSKDESKAKAKRLADEKAVSEKRLIDAAAIADAEAAKNDSETLNDEVNTAEPADKELAIPEKTKPSEEGDVEEIAPEAKVSAEEKTSEVEEKSAPEEKVSAEEKTSEVEEKSAPETPTTEGTNPDAEAIVEEKVLEAEEEPAPETPAVEETNPDAEATAEEK